MVARQWITFFGSPAYAGIDPRDGKTYQRVEGFPRLRGDRPFNGPVYGVDDLVPPPTRG